MRNSPTVRGKIRVTGLLSLLELLSLLSLLRVAAGGGSPSGGSPSTWGTAAVGEWLFEEGFGVYREDFASHGIDGHSLLNLREHYLGEHFKIQRTERIVIMDAIGRLRQGILDQPADLWDWRAANGRHHDALLSGIVNCPRVTILYLYHFEYKKSLRPLFYRDGTGLGFWTSWLLCPRIEIAHYLDEFKGTHPDLVKHMWVTAILSTITEGCGWLLLFCAPRRLPANERGVDGDIVKATLSKALMVVGLWLLHPVLSHQFQDYCVYVLLAWPYLGILMGLFYVKEVGKWLANGCTSDPLAEPILKGE